MVARDTLQGEMAAEYMAEHWADTRDRDLDDGQAYGQGLAEATKAELNRRGVTEAIFEQITPGQADYSDGLAESRRPASTCCSTAATSPRQLCLIRQARDRGYDLQMVGSDALFTEYFWHAAGPAAVGVRFVSMADPRVNADAAQVVEKFRAEGYEPEGLTLYSYAALQVWAQAVEKAGTFEADAVAEALHATNSTPSSAGSASTTRATFTATSLSPGTSGRRATTRRPRIWATDRNACHECRIVVAGECSRGERKVLRWPPVEEERRIFPQLAGGSP